MKEELEKQLFDKYPNLYADKDLPCTQSLVCFGFEMENGWYSIIDELSSKLEELIVKFKQDFPNEEHPKASQMKEKFGGLRFYMTSATDKMFALIDEAEKKCDHTCEICGEPGKLQPKGWLSVRCEKCKK